MTPPTTASPGYFGKLPAKGDFLSWRVPTDLLARWDGWLGELTLVSREAAGPAWPEVWLTAPLWHFTLGAGLVADHPACGVLIASVDRVGRMFPFTIIGEAGGEPEEDWTEQVEVLALAALADDADLAALQEGLRSLGPPRSASGVAPGQSIWWCRGSDLAAPRRSIVEGLPSPEASRAMILPDDPAVGAG